MLTRPAMEDIPGYARAAHCALRAEPRGMQCLSGQ